LLDVFRTYYAADALIEILDEIPEIRNVTQKPTALIGGFTVDNRDARRVCVVACIDNLLKGAASQALQNMNLMLGFDEYTGIVAGTE